MPNSPTDTLALIGNASFFLGFLRHYHQQIVDRCESNRPLSDAPNYYAWLVTASEYVCYAVKQLIFLRSESAQSEVFNWTYSRLLDTLFIMEGISPELRDDVLLFARIRHLLVHKGFPNPHDTPSADERKLADGVIYTMSEVWNLRDRIRHPSAYDSLKATFDRTVRALEKLEVGP
jgi:hypothetical protein